MPNKLFLFGLKPLMILKRSSKDEIHDERLIGNDDGKQKDRVLLRRALEMVDEVEQKMAIVDDFPEENQLVHEKFSPICFGVADEGVIDH